MNRRLVLNLLRRAGSLSRVAIAAQTGLSAPAVTGVVADLIDEGFLIEQAASAGALGRRPIPIGLNYAGRLAIGVKLMVASIECVVTDLSTTPLASFRQTLADSSPQTFVDAITAAIPVLTSRANRSEMIVGIGISLPGVIDTDLGICRRSHRLDWDDVPLAAMVAARSRVPVWLEDDTNAYAIAQHLFGLGRQHSNMAALAIGAGISCAMILDGKLYRGGHGAAGKFGHTIHNPAGPLCECGRRGCLMAFYAEQRLIAAWRDAAGREASAGRAEMLAALAGGDGAAISILGEAGHAIGRHLATFVNIVDPEIIVVGGEAVAFGEALFGPLRTALARFTFRPPPPVQPDWDDASWSRGAAALTTQHLFDFEKTGIAATAA